jgi:hypothetical protein
MKNTHWIDLVHETLKDRGLPLQPLAVGPVVSGFVGTFPLPDSEFDKVRLVSIDDLVKLDLPDSKRVIQARRKWELLTVDDRIPQGYQEWTQKFVKGDEDLEITLARHFFKKEDDRSQSTNPGDYKAHNHIYVCTNLTEGERRNIEFFCDIGADLIRSIAPAIAEGRGEDIMLNLLRNRAGYKSLGIEMKSSQREQEKLTPEEYISKAVDLIAAIYNSRFN